MRDFCAKLAGQGYHVYSPIQHWHPVVVAHDLPTNAAYWLDQNNASLDHSDAMIVFCLDGWRGSVGVEGEIDRAHSRRMEIEYFDKAGLHGRTENKERRRGSDRRVAPLLESVRRRPDRMRRLGTDRRHA